MKSDDHHAIMRKSNFFFLSTTLERTPDVLDMSLELAPYRKAGSYWLREVSQSLEVIGGHWKSLEDDSDQS